tara:strand:+ start:1336 stop:1827 length:492 start_codon:yes stop_codon:yes gene_type:complete
MITRSEIDELFEWASTTKFPLYKLNNPEHYSNKRIDYSWNKLVDHKNKSTIRRKFMTESIIKIHQNPEILWSAIGVFYAGTKVSKHKDPDIFSCPYKRIQIPIKIPSVDKCYMIWEDGSKTIWEVGEPQVHNVMDIAHNGCNLSDEEMIFLFLDVKKTTEVKL